MIKRISALLSIMLLVLSIAVTVSASYLPTITVSSSTAEPGDTVELDVSIDNNPGISAFVFGFDYDTSVLSLESVNLSSGIDGTLVYKDKAVWLNDEDLNKNGNFLKLKFTVSDSAKKGEIPVAITYSSNDIVNFNEENVSFECVSGKIKISKNGSDSTKPEYTTDKNDTEKDPDEVSLAQVKNIKVKKTTSSSIQLSWKKVEGAEKYKVYYSTNGKKWKSKTTSKTTYTVKRLVSGQSYQLKVKAIAGEVEGEISDIRKTATRVDEAILDSVKSSKLSQAVVKWDRTDGASGYVIEYSTSKKFTKKTTKTVTVKKGKTTKTTLKKLKSGKKYYVRIKAYKTVNKKAVYGAYSSVKTVKVK